MLAPDWAQKNPLPVLLLPIGQQYPPRYFRVLVHEGYFFAILAKKCTQSGNFQFDKDTVHFKILSSRKLKHGTVCNGILKTLFQKYKLELTTSLHRSISLTIPCDRWETELSRCKLEWSCWYHPKRFPESSVVPSFLVREVENESFPCTHNLGERTIIQRIFCAQL